MKTRARLLAAVVGAAGLDAMLCCAQATPAETHHTPGGPFVQPETNAVTPSLSIGDPAPVLKVEKWINSEPVAALAPGKVYIVEFWASWCVPCARSIPRLSGLQSAYRDRGVTVVSIASQEMTPGDLEKFVAKQGDKMNYRIALDDHGETSAAWMTAAGQRGIPTAFVINKEQKIAWIGHPMNGLDEALSQVVDGKYDLAAARERWKHRVELETKAAPIAARYQEASDEGDAPKAIAAADELLALDSQQFGEYAWKKFQLIALLKKDEPMAYAWAEIAIGGPIKGNATALAALASVIAADPRLQTRDLAIAERAAQRANELSGGSRENVLAVLARIAALRDNWPAAIDWQTKAVAAALDEQTREGLARTLSDYNKKTLPK